MEKAKGYFKKLYIWFPHTGAQLKGGRGRGLPCPFLKIEKVALEYLGKKLQNFTCGAFSSCAFNKIFYRSALIRKTSLALKNFWLRACYTNIILSWIPYVSNIPSWNFITTSLSKVYNKQLLANLWHIC